MNTPFLTSDNFKYVRQHSLPPLEKKVERELVLRAKDGDLRAMDILVRSNIRFVIKIASKYAFHHKGLDDLFSEGCIGLREGILRYDTNQDIKLISYAVWWIRQRIARYLQNQTSIVRPPYNRLQDSRRADKLAVKISKQFNAKRISKHDVDFLLSEDVDTMLKCDASGGFANTFNDVSLDKEYDNSSESTMLSRLTYSIDDASDIDADDVEMQMMFSKVENKLRVGLNSRDLEILGTWFGVFGYASECAADYADRHGISRERARQLRMAVVKKLGTVLGKSNLVTNPINAYKIMTAWASPNHKARVKSVKAKQASASLNQELVGV